jgi:hypothetical protein
MHNPDTTVGALKSYEDLRTEVPLGFCSVRAVRRCGKGSYRGGYRREWQFRGSSVCSAAALGSSFGLFIGVPGAADGTNFAILDTGYFTVQTLNTTPGSTYHLSFAVSGNSAFPGTSVANFTWDNGPTNTTTWLSPNTPGDGTHYNWVYGNFDLLATSSLTTLRFERDVSSIGRHIFGRCPRDRNPGTIVACLNVSLHLLWLPAA